MLRIQTVKKDLVNNDLSSLNGNEGNFIFEEIDNENETQKENEKEKEDERNKQIYLKQREVKIALDIGNYNTLVLPGNTTLNTT